MGRKEKELMVVELTDKIQGANGVVLTDYQGLTVAEISDLRAKLRPLKCEYKVVKNTLVRRVLKSSNLEDFSNFFSGPAAIAIQNGDPVQTAKILVNFAKEHSKLKVRAGLLDKKVLSQKQVEGMAALPSKEILLSQLLGVMQSPISGFMNVLNGSMRNFVYVLNAIKQQKAS